MMRLAIVPQCAPPTLMVGWQRVRGGTGHPPPALGPWPVCFPYVKIAKGPPA